MNTFAFTLDLSKTAYMEPLRIRQGDQNGTTVQATILDHGVALDGSYTARFCMRHPGTGATYYRETGTYANGVATVALDEQYAASVPGRTTAYIQLLQGSTVIASTSDIPVVILHDATEDAAPGEVYDSAIEDALAELDEATGRISIMVQEQVAEELAAHHEWTTTVQDNSLTDAKLIQSGGILSRNQRLMYRLANLLTHRTDEGTLAAISDAAKTPMAGLSVYGLSTQDGTPTPSSPVSIESVGTANLIVQPYDFTSKTVNGITWTANADGTLTANGTATNNSALVLNNRDMFGSHPKGTYTLSGSPAVEGCYVRIQYATAAGDMAFVSSTAGNPVTFTTDTELQVATGNNNLFLMVPNGTTVNNAVFRPMLNAGSTAYPYVPYGHAGLWAKRTSDASTYTVTPIDLDGHELRSLPDGTRDELTVDAEGHVTLVQRVGAKSIAASDWTPASNNRYGANISPAAVGGNANVVSTAYTPNTATTGPANAIRIGASGTTAILAPDSTLVDSELLYALATPVTHDLGTVPLVPLVGPDLTAQTVPTAPFVLDAERDLNVTLARLEAAIAALA
jgi:hypothetical protein